jgi:hypothetical protein
MTVQTIISCPGKLGEAAPWSVFRLVTESLCLTEVKTCLAQVDRALSWPRTSRKMLGEIKIELCDKCLEASLRGKRGSNGIDPGRR